MQDEIKFLKEKVDYLENKKWDFQNLQDRLDTCENQNGAIFGIQSNNQVCERKIEGFGQALFQWSENFSLNALIHSLL